jgi:futalosine hydrolase
MKILLVAATKNEVLKSNFEDLDILHTGVGMVNTTLKLTQKLSVSSYDLVINLGIAGTFKNELRVGDVVEVIEDTFSEIGYQDKNDFFQFTDFNIIETYKVKGQTSLVKVKGITVNTVHGNKDSIVKVVEKFNPDIESMEGAAVFKVCEEFKIPCMQIRAISNIVEERNKEKWNIPLAINNLNKSVEQIISKL